MAGQTRRSSVAIIRALSERGREFSFVQVIRLIRAFLGLDALERNRVRVRPDLSLAFPAADVAKVEVIGSEEPLFKIIATFFGLYGVSSSLPTHVTEELFDEFSNDKSTSRDFLDIIHQRLYSLYIQCWRKYRLFISVVEERDPKSRQKLFSLLGLGERQLAESLKGAHSLLRYISLLGIFPRSGLGLRTLLREATGFKRLNIVQCVKRMARIPPDQRTRLGSACCSLGTDTVLGSEIADRMGKIIIRIDGLTWKEFNDLLPGTPLHDRIATIVRLYLIDPVEVYIELILAKGEAKPLRIGDPELRLGLNTWCFSGGALDEARAVHRLSAPSFESLPPALQDFCHPSAGEPGATLLDYFLKELARLRELGAEFGREHPEVAALVSGPMPDPAVERLFEGLAFLTALLQMKLDDDFPEIIHSLTERFHPWYLRPIPPTCLIAFTPGPKMKQPQLVPAGTEVASVEVKGTGCLFRACHETEVYPLTLVDASFSQPPGKSPRIRLRMELKDMVLSDFRAKKLRFFLGDEHLCLLLTRFLDQVIIAAAESGSQTTLPADCVRPAGLGDNETILTGGPDSFKGHQILQEYFLFPYKGRFVELSGFEKWKDRGAGQSFDITFELTECPFGAPTVTNESFVLSAVPVINLFSHRAIPLDADASGRQQVRPAGKTPEHYQVYRVDRVSLAASGTVKRKDYSLFNPFFRKSKHDSAYQVTREKSPVRQGFDTYLSLPARGNGALSEGGKLTVDLTCTNGALPERLSIGDIRIASSGTPESVEFRNITPVTPAIPPSTGTNRLWRLLSALSLNCLSLCTAENFRSILRLYIPYESRNQAEVAAHEKRIEGIVGIEAKRTDRIISGTLYRGYEIQLKLRRDHFSGPGDMYLFSSVLEPFFGGYVTENCFTRLIVEDVTTALVFDWPARLGDRHVL